MAPADAVRVGLALVLLSVVSMAAAAPAAGTFTVAVVRDGDGPEMSLAGAVRAELQGLLPSGVALAWQEDAAFAGDWTYAGAAAALDRALAAPGVDAVLAIGPLVLQAAADAARPLPRPVVSSHVRRADLGALPLSADGAIGKDNLFFMAMPQRAERDVTSFRELVGFDTLHVLIGAELIDSPVRLQEKLTELAARLGFGLVVVPVRVADGVARFDADPAMTAAYITRLERLGESGRRELLAGLTADGVATFGMLGHADVELGALAGLTPDISLQVVRRVALGLNSLARGGATARLQPLLSVDSRLLVNGATAARLGWQPSLEALLFAEFLHPEALKSPAESLDLARALELATEGNQFLKVEDSRVQGAYEDQFRSRSALQPQLIGEADYRWRDTDFGVIQTDDSGAFGRVLLRQQIYDDGSWTRYKASKQIYESTQQQREAARLDVLERAGLAFYDLARAEVFRQIQQANLRLTEDFLELARLRRDVGYSGREEILRWESELASQRTSVLKAVRDTRSARIELNRILGLPQEWLWDPGVPSLDAGRFPWLDGRLAAAAGDMAGLAAILEEAVRIGLENAPELSALDRSIDAQGLVAGQLRRSYALPKFYVDAAYEDRLTSPDADQLLVFEDNWSVSVNASYPIFTGGKRKHDLLRAEVDLDGLQAGWLQVAELVERGVRSSFSRIESSFPSILFARQSAAAAAQNLELMRERYTEGLINVTDLLEAQNQKLTADQLAAAAEYDFLSDLVRFQRSLAWFESEHDAEERQALAARILAAVAAP